MNIQERPYKNTENAAWTTYPLEQPADMGVGARMPSLRATEPRLSPSMWQMGHDLRMKSRVHPKYKTKYRVNNWTEYDQALVQRGNITLWISDGAIASWKPAPTGRRGAQRKFSDHAIETALTLRLIFKLPLRQAEGFLRSVLALMEVDLDAPDHTTLSRRSQSLNVDLHRVACDGPIHLIVDSTGLSIIGEGEWAAAKYGGRGRRGWKKLHLGVDRTGMIIAHALTGGDVNDAKTALNLIAEVHCDIRSVTADSAYDTLAIYDASAARGAAVIVPPSRSATDRASEDLGGVLAIVRS